jgi:hypothetical protein
MRRASLIGILALVFACTAAARPAAVAPPTQPGPWRQLGAATSKPAKLVSLARQLVDPHALAVVVVSSSKRPIRGTWYSYCEIDSDDGPTEDLSGTLSGTKRITKYFSLMKGSTSCQVQVAARVAGTPKARVTVAVFGY